MAASQLDKVNYLNIAAMLIASALAIVVPFELVLLSYAILGPLHYLTEISWLRDKQFFSPKKYDLLPIAVLVAVCLALRLPFVKIVYYTFGVTVIQQLIKSDRLRAMAFILLAASSELLLSHNLWRTIFGLYVPTLIHVYVFTGAFLLLGALRNRARSGYLAVLIFVLCPIFLCFLFTSVSVAPSNWAIDNYGDFTKLNRTSLRNHTLNVFNDKSSIILTRVIAFAYTYHYINWFSKTPIIGWHKISTLKAVVIGIIWIASVALYFYDYRQGFKWLFLLSFAHVVLEFPLNQRTFVGIGKELKRKALFGRS